MDQARKSLAYATQWIPGAPVPKDWNYGTFECHKNIGLCCYTLFCPALVFGNNAAAVGEDCVKCGLAFCCAGPFSLILQYIIRQKIREQRNIAGDSMNDILCLVFCQFCSLVQEAAEVQGEPPPIQAMARE